MPDKNWIIFLDDHCHLLVFLQTDGATVVGFAVVLVSTVDGNQACITRYDTAHGQAHRDVLGRKSGLMQKEWLVDLTFNEAFDYALDDLKANHGDYLKDFLEN